jgi:hypothetical protein
MVSCLVSKGITQTEKQVLAEQVGARKRNNRFVENTLSIFIIRFFAKI